ncbi:MAG TPA: hypothetical protein VMA72_21485 [Streptosporangiaceae bacterium]|nr:hypothetical protein [Streptosporangiaceae bacterium]
MTSYAYLYATSSVFGLTRKPGQLLWEAPQARILIFPDYSAPISQGAGRITVGH